MDSIEFNGEGSDRLTFSMIAQSFPAAIGAEVTTATAIAVDIIASNSMKENLQLKRKEVKISLSQALFNEKTFNGLSEKCKTLKRIAG